MPNYQALTGLSYPPDKTVNEGDVVDDIPSKSVKWLLDQGYIVEVKGGKGAPVAAAPSNQDGE